MLVGAAQGLLLGGAICAGIALALLVNGRLRTLVLLLAGYAVGGWIFLGVAKTAGAVELFSSLTFGETVQRVQVEVAGRPLYREIAKDDPQMVHRIRQRLGFLGSGAEAIHKAMAAERPAMIKIAASRLSFASDETIHALFSKHWQTVGADCAEWLERGLMQAEDDVLRSLEIVYVESRRPLGLPAAKGAAERELFKQLGAQDSAALCENLDRIVETATSLPPKDGGLMLRNLIAATSS